MSNKKKKVYSFYNKKGKLYVDCMECKRGANGLKDCSAAGHIKRPGQGGCFIGSLLDGITPRDMRV